MATIEELDAEIARQESLLALDAEISKRESEEQQASKQILLDQINKDVGPFESAFIGIGRGLTDIGRAAGLAEEEDPELIKQFQGLSEQRPITQIGGRVVGQALPFLAPAVGAGAIASIPARVAASVLIGGTEGAAIESGTGGGDVAQAAGIGGVIAGAAEAFFPMLSRLGSALIKRIRGKEPASVFDAAGNPTAELEEALSQSGITLDDLNQQAQSNLLQQSEATIPEQAVRAAQFEQVGLTPTKAQLTRDAADFQAQQEAAKTSGRVRDVLESQEGLLVNRFDEAVAGTGGSPVTSGSPVIDKVINISTSLDNQISDLYQAARQSAPTEKFITLNKTSTELSKLKDFERSTGGLPSSVRGFLKNRGLVDSSGKLITSNKGIQKEITNLKSRFKKSGLKVNTENRVINSLGQINKKATEQLFDLNLKNTGRKLNVAEAESLRIDMNSLFNSITPFGRDKLRGLKNALDDDVLTAAGDDFFKQGRAVKADFENKLNRAKISKFDNRKSNLVRDVLENKINPDTFVNDVVNSKKWRASDLEELKQFSTDGGKDLAPWNDLRAETLDSIKLAAFKGPEDALGNKALSRDGLQKALSKIGTEKLKVIFDPKELKFLKDILNVTKLREPVRGTALGKGPSAQALQNLESRARNLPLVGSIIDLVDFDAAGRAVIKSNPEKIIRQRTNIEKVLPGAVSVPLIASQEE